MPQIGSRTHCASPTGLAFSVIRRPGRCVPAATHARHRAVWASIASVTVTFGRLMVAFGRKSLFRPANGSASQRSWAQS